MGWVKLFDKPIIIADKFMRFASAFARWASADKLLHPS